VTPPLLAPVVELRERLPALLGRAASFAAVALLNLPRPPRPAHRRTVKDPRTPRRGRLLSSAPIWEWSCTGRRVPRGL